MGAIVKAAAGPAGGSEQGAQVDWPSIETWDRTHVLHPMQGRGEYVFRPVSSAEGCWLYLADGSRLLDFQSQLISDSMGHRHPAVVAALIEAVGRYGHVAANFATDYRAKASKLVVEDLLGPDDWAGRVRFLVSGTEAVESALMMARFFTGRDLVLTQRHSYHGFTPTAGTSLRGYSGQLATLDGTGIRNVPGSGRRDLVVIPPPEPQDFDATDGLPSLEETARIIEETGPNRIAAVITEAMFGAGGILGHQEYLVGLRELTRKHGILWIDDEVVCGFGRLGEWFGYQLYDGLVPDLMAIGKGINSCILPAGGVVASRELADFFEGERWYQSSTHEGHPLVCATIAANIEVMRSEGIVERAAENGRYLRAGLEQLKGSHRSIGRIAGTGMCYAVDLVNGDGEPIVPADREFGFDGDLTEIPTNVILRESMKREVYLGGIMPNTIKAAPPLTVSRDEIDLALEAFDAGLDVVERMYC